MWIHLPNSVLPPSSRVMVGSTSGIRLACQGAVTKLYVEIEITAAKIVASRILERNSTGRKHVR